MLNSIMNFRFQLLKRFSCRRIIPQKPNEYGSNGSISHSMILIGKEDRITLPKKVAMALTEFIKTRYPKDSIEVIVFG